MIISNTVNSFIHNHQLTKSSFELYYTRYFNEFSNAGKYVDNLVSALPYTIPKIENDIRNVSHVNDQLVHIIFDIRLLFLKQYKVYLQPNIYFLIGDYQDFGTIPTKSSTTLFLFIEKLSERVDDLYAMVAYYFTKLYIHQTEYIQHFFNEQTQIKYPNMLLEEIATLGIMRQLSINYPFMSDSNYNKIQKLEQELHYI